MQGLLAVAVARAAQATSIHSPFSLVCWATTLLFLSISLNLFPNLSICLDDLSISLCLFIYLSFPLSLSTSLYLSRCHSLCVSVSCSYAQLGSSLLLPFICFSCEYRVYHLVGGYGVMTIIQG